MAVKSGPRVKATVRLGFERFVLGNFHNDTLASPWFGTVPQETEACPYFDRTSNTQ